MLPITYRQAYQNLLDILLVTRELVVNTQAMEQETFGQLQQIVFSQILPLTDEGLDPQLAIRWRALQTELHRTWRLMETDRLFLSSARQNATRQARSSVFLGRLDRMVDYCRILLE